MIVDCGYNMYCVTLNDFINLTNDVKKLQSGKIRKEVVTGNKYVVLSSSVKAVEIRKDVHGYIIKEA